MESSVDTTSTTFNCNSSSSASPSPTSSPPPHPIVVSPCAACKILRRRCVDKCVLAPYFPPTEPLKFTTAHRVFGASNIIKFLQELPESQRADAVSSMVYEANARIRDPVYGCAGAICQLQKQVSELQAELARAQAELINMQTQHANLIAIICMEMANSQQQQQQQQQYCIPPSSAAIGIENIPNGFLETESFFLEDNSQAQGSLWEEPFDASMSSSTCQITLSLAAHFFCSFRAFFRPRVLELSFIFERILHHYGSNQRIVSFLAEFNRFNFHFPGSITLDMQLQ